LNGNVADLTLVRSQKSTIVILSEAKNPSECCWPALRCEKQISLSIYRRLAAV